MNGFLFFDAGVPAPATYIERALPLGPDVQLERTTCSRGDQLLVWGHRSAGDIHYSQHPGGSLTILCGYISEIDRGPKIVDQEQAVSFIGEAFRSDTSITALTELLNRLHGSFAVFHRDFGRETCFCLADRVASRPLWKLRTGGGWIVSSHPMAIAAAVPSIQLDFGALGAYLLYGGPIQPLKSLFQGVEAVRPGSISRLADDGFTQETVWYRYRHVPENDRNTSAWLDLVCDRLVHSASRIAQQCSRPAVFFSGGVDSRLTAAALKAAGANPLLVTLGDGRNLECRISEQAAAAMDLQHVVIFRDKHWYLGGLPTVVFETGGSFVWTHGHFSRAVRQLRADFDTEAFLLGDLCEAFSKLFCSVQRGRGRVWTTQEFTRDFDRIMLPLYRPKNRQATLALLNRDIRRDVERALNEDISDRYESAVQVSSDPWIVGDTFFRWESAGTLPTFSMFLDLRSAAAERNLMLDKDVSELLELAPSRLRNGANFGAMLVRRLHAKASRVPNSNSLLPLCWPPFAHAFSKTCKPVLGKMRRLMIGNSHRTTGAWPEKAVLYATDPAWRLYFDTILNDEDILPARLFDRDQVRRAWRAVLDGDRNSARDVEKLVQFGVMNGQTRRDSRSVLQGTPTSL